jgi:hypothetical protein
MGRPSKLTEAQWAEVERRVLHGETARALGREFGVSEGAIRQRFGVSTRVSTQSTQVQETARKIADANTALAALPPTQRPAALSLAEKLQNISESLASAAALGAATSHRLSALANVEVSKIDDAKVLSAESMDAMRGVAALTKLANESSNIAINLLSANKDRMKEPPPPEDLPTIDPAKLSNSALEEIMGARIAAG